MDPRLIVFALGAFAVGTGGFVIAGILPLISDSLGVSVTTAGQLVTVFAIAYAVCSLVLAAATGRLPRRALLATALAVFIVGNIATALAAAFGLILGSWVVTAIGAAYRPCPASTSSAGAGSGRVSPITPSLQRCDSAPCWAGSRKWRSCW